MTRLLTALQPFPDLILAGVKPVENRTRPFPGTVPLGSRIWLHAGARQHPDPGDLALDVWSGANPVDAQYRLGVVLGSVEVTGCHHADECAHVDWEKPARDLPWVEHCSRWAESDVWHWTLAVPIPLAEPIPAKGRLGLWRPDDDLAARLDQAVTA